MCCYELITIWCVVWDILNRENLMQTLINALQGKNYDYAVKILLDVAKEV